MKVNVGGTLKTVVSAKVNVAGTLRTVTKVRHNVGGTIKAGDTFTVPLSLSASPTSIYGFSTTNPVIAGSVSFTPTGGLAPYTYSTVRTSGSGSVLSPTSAVTSFSDSIPVDTVSNGVFTCTVTDSLGATATAEVAVEFERFSAS